MPQTLQLPAIVVDQPALAKAGSREPFDQLCYEMVARSGRMAEQVVAAVERATPAEGLTLDEAVIGGLLVRTAKLTRGIFDATQAEESEAHLPLSRCAAETAITLRWLAAYGTEESFRRFRADSFAYWRKELERMRSQAECEDQVSRATREKVEHYIEREISAAGVRWEEVPGATNSWGPDLRQRCHALEEEWVYDGLFASHSNYVHPSWHELRALHLASQGGVLSLDGSFGGIAPITAYVVARLVAEASGAAAEFLPCDLDPRDTSERVRNTVEASQLLAVEFAEFTARGGLDEDLQRPSG